MSRNYRFTITATDSIDKAKQIISISSKDLLHQINNVLRLRVGHPEEVTLIDGSEDVFYVELLSIDKSQASFTILKTQKSQRELSAEISFLVPVIKADAFSWMIRKLTELGVQNFIPVIFERSQKVNIQALNSAKSYERLTKIIQEATEQCEGAVFAKLNEVIEFNEIENHLELGSLKIFANERLANVSPAKLQQGLEPLASDTSSKIALLIGPEGGLTDQEVKALESLNFMPFGLGKRLLKAETAAICLATKFAQ